jgi:hypothetical protein
MWLLSVLLFFAQGVPFSRAEDGTISGVLKTAAGAPAAGVRVAAAVVNREGPTKVNALVSITETGPDGRYLLEDIPPGRYYILAGRIDQPTFYPGTLQLGSGTSIAVTPGARISRIDFSIQSESTGRAGVGVGVTPQSVALPIDIRLEDGGKVPLFVGTLYPVLRLTEPNQGARESYFNANAIFLPPSPGEYRVEVRDLPTGYMVRSITDGPGQGAVDLTKNPLRLSPPSPNATQVFAVSIPPNLPITGIVNAARFDKTLFVVLARDPQVVSNASGVRVSGTTIPSDLPIYLSGASGTVFTDGSFEFKGVLPGRHSLVRFVSSANSHGISIVVGDRDVDGVRLQSTTILPRDIEADAPRPAGTHAAGSTLPLGKIGGRVVQESSGESLAVGGTVTLTGYQNAKRVYAIDGEGRFAIPGLLPGSYLLQLAVSGYEADTQTVVIDDGDAEITFRGRAVPGN